MKLIIPIALAMTVQGCALFGGEKIRIVNEIIEVDVPVAFCPAPPVIARPVLQVNTLTDIEKASDGELVKAYAASVVQLIGYAQELEDALGAYDATNLAYDQLIREFEAESEKTGDSE